MAGIYILDAGAAFTLASIDGFDALTAGGGRVVITQDVLDEINKPQFGDLAAFKAKFNAWFLELR